MRGFIEITALNRKKIFINIDFIVMFRPDESGNTEIMVSDGLNKPIIVATSSKPDEIADMIDLARS